MYFDNLALILSTLEIIAVYQRADFLGVIRIFAGHKNNRLYIVEVVFTTVLAQHSLAMLMKRKTVSNFHLLDIVLIISRHVGAAHNDRDLQISLDSATSKIIGINDIRCGLRRGGKLKSENWLQIIDCLH